MSRETLWTITLRMDFPEDCSKRLTKEAIGMLIDAAGLSRLEFANEANVLAIYIKAGPPVQLPAWRPKR